jgi:NAD(P)-dependent dehydrogenase (short-subunit alcohol dehydrogenase family)
LKQNPEYPPTLIFTGATASVKANAMVSVFNTGKYALRALSSSLAKEFGPQGIHVGHAIIDGAIDIERTKEWMKDAGPDAKISPIAVSLINCLMGEELMSLDRRCLLALAYTT